MTSVYISIGNPDDKLTQQRWHEFAARLLRRIDEVRLMENATVHGVWWSEPGAPWQNMCVCVEVSRGWHDWLRGNLRELAVEFGQDSVTFMAGEVELIGPVP